MIEINQCPVCESNALLPFVTCQDHSISHETFSIVQCTDCKLLITSPRPSQDNLDKYYVSPTYTSHARAAKTIIDKIYFRARQITLKWKLSLLEKHNPAAAEKRLFDFGCGTGEFLKVAKLNGWITTGMEPSDFARQHADPLIATDIQPTLNKITETHPKFHAITLWHVLEHVDDLNNTLQILKSLLEQGGTIFIAVPNHASWDRVHYKQNWAAYDVPRHFWHFTRLSMERLLNKHGLTLEKIIPMRLDAYYISLLSEKYQNTDDISIATMIKAFISGLRSNYHAGRSKEYSSLIYVIKK